MVGLLLSLQSWEALRFARSRTEATIPGIHPAHRVTVFVPCKGYDLQLHENLTAIFQQDHPHFEICFIVEDVRDTAVPVIRELQREFCGVPSRLVVAGLANHTGQKVHNLLAGLAAVDDSANMFAFIDSDAQPASDWLRALVHRAERDACAATGYRWVVPEKSSLANAILYSANSAAAALYGPGRHHLVWGGSWAISRSLFEQIGITEAWRDCLSDDLVASRAIHFAKVGVAFEPRSVAVSPIDATPRQAVEFIRRQLVVGRCYAPKQWWLSFAGLACTQIAFWGSVAKVWSNAVHSSWSNSVLWSISALALWGITALRSYWRQSLVDYYAPQAICRLATVRWADIFLGSFMGALVLTAFGSVLGKRRIVWRGNGYQILAGGRVQFVGRRSSVTDLTEIRHSVRRAA